MTGTQCPVCGDLSDCPCRLDVVDLLRAAIERSGLSARAFASQVLLRDERTVRRWLAGDSPIPQAVIDWLRDSVK